MTTDGQRALDDYDQMADVYADDADRHPLLTDTWRKGGREFQVRFYHRPLSAISDALAGAGFLIERIVEPVPDREAFADDPAFYQRMMRCPWFLFVRAITRPGAHDRLDREPVLAGSAVLER
jgi:hypothetical protein